VIEYQIILYFILIRRCAISCYVHLKFTGDPYCLSSFYMCVCVCTNKLVPTFVGGHEWHDTTGQDALCSKNILSRSITMMTYEKKLRTVFFHYETYYMQLDHNVHVHVVNTLLGRIYIQYDLTCTRISRVTIQTKAPMRLKRFFILTVRCHIV